MGEAIISRILENTDVSVVQETGISTTDVMSQKAVTDELNNKVDKVDGKGLSSEDFTAEDKEKLDNAVPQTRTINSKQLTDYIVLTATDIGAAPYEIHSSADFNDITTPGIYTMCSSTTNSPSGSHNGLIVLKSNTGNYVEQIAIEEGNGQIYVRYLNGGSTWSDWEQISLSNHTHSAEDINTGTLSVSRGGTGQTSLTSGAILLGNGSSAISTTSILPVAKGGTGSASQSGALNNLGLPKESGNWTPSINASGVSYQSRSGYYHRIGNMVYIFCYLLMNITNAGSDYAKISGLPFSAHTGLKAGFELIDTGNLAMIPAGGTTSHASFINSWGGTSIGIRTADGAVAQKWSTGNNRYLSFSGWYVKA